MLDVQPSILKSDHCHAIISAHQKRPRFGDSMFGSFDISYLLVPPSTVEFNFDVGDKIYVLEVNTGGQKF